MANYKDIINAATQGFKNIQNAIYNLSDNRPSEITQVTSSTSNGVQTFTGNVTPDTMVTAIGKLATIKISNTSTNNVHVNQDSNGYISGQVKYVSGTITKNPSFESSNRKVSYTQTLLGYYDNVTIKGETTISAGSVTINGAGLSASDLSQSGEVSSAFKPSGVVGKSNATNTTSHSYAKISRAAVSAITSPGYITENEVTNNISTSATPFYVEIPNATFSKTDAKVNISAGITQAEYVGSTNQNTADLNIFETTTPGANVAYYLLTATPSLDSVPTKGTVKATAGYAKLNDGRTDVSVTTNTVSSTPRYIIKSTLNRSTITWANQTATISKGYYPTDRTVSLSMSSAVATTTNTVAPETTKYYDGSNSTNVSTEILQENAPATGRYYTIKVNSTVDGSVTTPGYLSAKSQMGLNNGTVTRHIPELQGTIDITGVNTILGYTQSSTAGTLLNMLDNGSSNVGSGITSTAPTGKVEGTDYWRVQAVEGTTHTSTTVTASLNVTKSGYLDSTLQSGSPKIIGNGTKTVSPTGTADLGATFYVSLPTMNVTVSGTSNIDCGKPAIKLNNASNGTNSINVNSSAATTTKPTTGYFVAVKSDAISSAVLRSLTATATTTSGGYTYKNKNFSGNGSITASYQASEITYIPITSGVAKNGYVTTAGWIQQNSQVYSLSYDSDEECVDFIFNE